MSGMWDHIPVEALIAQKVPPYGLEAIRRLPEIDTRIDTDAEEAA